MTYQWLINVNGCSFLQYILLNLKYGKFWKRFIEENYKCRAAGD